MMYRRLFLLVMVTVLALPAMAQFELTMEGLRTEDQSHYVIEVEGKSQKELYDLSKLYFTKVYKSASNVLSEAAPSLMTINAKEPKAVHRNKFHVFDMAYSFTVQFKDGKVRCAAPAITLTTFTSSAGSQTLKLVSKNSLGGGTLGIWSPKGKLKSKLAKADIEKFFKVLFTGLEKTLKEGDEW